MDSQRSRPAKDYPWEDTFVANMQELRERRQMSQTDLAKRLKDRGLPFHQQTIQRIENRDRQVRLDEAFLIAAELGFNLESMTGSRLPSYRGLAWSMQQAIDRALDSTEAVHEDVYKPWVSVVDSIVLDLERHLRHFRNKEFNDLPEVLRLALAFCYKAAEVTRSLERAAILLAEFTDDGRHYRGQLRQVVIPVNQRLSTTLYLILERWDCKELQELASSQPYKLYTKAREAAETSAINPEVAKIKKQINSLYKQIKNTENRWETFTRMINDRNDPRAREESEIATRRLRELRDTQDRLVEELKKIQAEP